MMNEIDQAILHQRAGRLNEAERIYQRLLAAQRDHPDALHWLGVLALQRGNAATAVELIGRALKIKPDYLEAHSNFALALQAQGRLDDAVAAYERALVISPDDVDIHINLGRTLQAQGRLDHAIAAYQNALALETNSAEIYHALGTALRKRGRASEAVAAYQQAIKLKPDFAEAHNSLGVILLDAGKPQDAVAALQCAVRLKPAFTEAHYNLGNALHRAGRLDEAVAAYRQALANSPALNDARSNLGIVLMASKKLEEALTVFKQALEYQPHSAAAHYNLGTALHETGKLTEAIASYERAAALAPTDAAVWNNLGVALKDTSRLDEAIAAFKHAVVLRADFADAYANLGSTLAIQDKLTEAMVAYERALAIAPDMALAHANRGIALTLQGRPDEAIRSLRRALALQPDDAELHSDLIQRMYYCPDTSPETILAEARRWDEQRAAPLRADWRVPANGRDPERRLRVGYVSTDFRAHSVAFFVEPLLRAHDRRAFEIFCYANVKQPDRTTARLRGLTDQWRDVSSLDDARATEEIRGDKIDILVDLGGHTADNRLLVFARKPAPVQVTYLGHPGTTGLHAIDYRLTDALADPPGKTDAFHTEALVRLPGSFLCYQPDEDPPQVGLLPASRAGYLTFGSFNSTAKINEQVITCWAAILRAVPDSRFILKAMALADAGTRERFQACFTKHGVAAEHLDLRPWMPTAEHLQLYNKVDIALDPFPYNGTTTTCEALWMGAPVVTLAGTTHAGRVGASLLTHAGLPELIAESPEDYVKLAAALASDLERLQDLRQGLRERLQRSPLMDAEGFTRSLEAAYRGMWQKYCSERAGFWS